MGLTVQEHRTAVQRWLGGESRRVPMFRDAEITILVPQLVEALRLARENERVTYGGPNFTSFWEIGRPSTAFRPTA